MAEIPSASRSAHAPVAMNLIRSFGNKATELRLLRILRGGKISGWRRHLSLPGRPDFAFPREKVAIFVDGCFWHGCPQHYRPPRRNDYWQPKLQRNKARDRRATGDLRAMGWMVIRIWEHALADESHVIRRLRRAIESRRASSFQQGSRAASGA